MNQKSQDKLKRRIIYFTGFIFIVIIVRIFFFQIYVVSGNSMAPTLRNGDIVFVSKLGFPVTSEIFPWHFIYSKPNLNRLDIVIFEDQEGEISLKRLVGEPHEYYELNFGKVMIESTILDEDYIPDGAETNEPSNEIAYKYPDSPFIEMSKNGRIPPGYYLLLGDNREYSTDSRSFGFVPLSRLRGKVFATIK